MLLERVWAALDDFWSAQVWEGAQGPGAGRGTHGRGGGAASGVHKDIVELLMQQKAGADCQVWHSAPSLCSVCPPESTVWAELSGELLSSALLQQQTRNLLPSSIGRAGRFPWMFPVPATPSGRAALPQKLIVLPARRQLPSAPTQTAFWVCYCLDAWKSVDSLFCSICYSFGKMLNILQPEDRTKEGWGFC